MVSMTDTRAESETTSRKQTSPFAGNLLRRALAVQEVGVLLPLIGFMVIFYLINPMRGSNTPTS